jgi:hypothetical protein
LLVFAIHMVEEIPRFPAWATKHFGATSNAWYTYSHTLLVAFIVPVCAWSATGSPMLRILWVATACSLACNALFHVVTTWWFREYSPGVVTGVVALLPGAALVLQHSRLASTQLAVAAALGILSQVAVIASLWLKLDIGWDLRSRTR